MRLLSGKCRAKAPKEGRVYRPSEAMLVGSLHQLVVQSTHCPWHHKSGARELGEERGTIRDYLPCEGLWLLSCRESLKGFKQRNDRNNHIVNFLK